MKTRYQNTFFFFTFSFSALIFIQYATRTSVTKFYSSTYWNVLSLTCITYLHKIELSDTQSLWTVLCKKKKLYRMLYFATFWYDWQCVWTYRFDNKLIVCFEQQRRNSSESSELFLWCNNLFFLFLNSKLRLNTSTNLCRMLFTVLTRF